MWQEKYMMRYKNWNEIWCIIQPSKWWWTDNKIRAVKCVEARDVSRASWLWMNVLIISWMYFNSVCRRFLISRFQIMIVNVINNIWRSAKAITHRSSKCGVRSIERAGGRTRASLTTSKLNIIRFPSNFPIKLDICMNLHFNVSFRLFFLLLPRTLTRLAFSSSMKVNRLNKTGHVNHAKILKNLLIDLREIWCIYHFSIHTDETF